MVDRRAHEMGFGAAHAVSLAEARQKASDARTLCARGIDPLASKKTTQAEMRLKEALRVTFKDCAERYIAAHERSWRNEKHRAQWQATLATYAYPVSRGGRQAGTPNKATSLRIAKIAASGLMPLDYLLGLMRDENTLQEIRIEAAKAAAPYCHSRLATIESRLSVSNGVAPRAMITFSRKPEPTPASINNAPPPQLKF